VYFTVNSPICYKVLPNNGAGSGILSSAPLMLGNADRTVQPYAIGRCDETSKKNLNFIPMEVYQ